MRASKSKRRSLSRIGRFGVNRLHGGRRRRKYVTHDKEFTPLLWDIRPAGRNHVPYMVLQPSILNWVCRAQRSCTHSNVGVRTLLVLVIVWRYTSQDLIVTGNHIRRWDGSQRRRDTP